MNAIERLQMIVAGIRGRKLRDTEVIQFKANIHMKLIRPDGSEHELPSVHNLIVTAGKNELLKASSAKYLNQFAYMGIGSSSTSPASGNTALGTELARSTAITPTNPSAPVLQFQHTFAAGTGTGTVEEVGLFDASSSGNMLNRSLTGTIVKGAGDALQITIQIS